MTTLLFKVGVLEEREEQLVGEVEQYLDFSEIILSDSEQNSSDLIKEKPVSSDKGRTIVKSTFERKDLIDWSLQVEAEGVARRKAEARAQEAEGRSQVQEPPIHPSASPIRVYKLRTLEEICILSCTGWATSQVSSSLDCGFWSSSHGSSERARHQGLHAYVAGRGVHAHCLCRKTSLWMASTPHCKLVMEQLIRLFRAGSPWSACPCRQGGQGCR